MNYIEKKLALYECINKEDYLQQLTNKLSIYCDNPVLTVDYKNEVHSFFGRGNDNDLTWNDMIDTGELNTKWIQPFFHETMINLIENQKPLRIFYEDSHIILTPVITQNVYM